MTILIDADGCPVVDLTLQIAKQFSVPVIILCDACASLLLANGVPHEADSGGAGLWQCVSMMPYAPKTRVDG